VVGILDDQVDLPGPRDLPLHAPARSTRQSRSRT